MPKALSSEEIRAFRENGFHFPVRVLSAPEVAERRHQLELFERESGEPALRTNLHLLFGWGWELVHHPAILDPLEDLLGPDLLCWGMHFFVKAPSSSGFVSWHQDASYWGLEPFDVITAWLALSESSEESGAMQFVPSSHLWEPLPHTDTFGRDNMLSRGQIVNAPIDETRVILAPLASGEMSLHHVNLVHGSAPNRAGDRRIGIALRYMAPHVRQTKLRDTAVLVRGTDRYGHFDLLSKPEADLHPAARERHADANRRLTRVIHAMDYDSDGQLLPEAQARSSEAQGYR